MNELDRQAQEERAEEVAVQMDEAVEPRELTADEFRAVAGGPHVDNN
jgi:hypothetical protein